MSKPIKIIIKGSTASGADAPTVEDLLSQIQDFVAVLRGVEDAVSDNSPSEIDWRVTDVTKNSPLAFEVTPFPKRHGMNIDLRSEKVISVAAKGINSLAHAAERPLFFSDNLIGKVERLFDRLSNGLDETKIDLSEYVEAEPVTLTKKNVVGALRNIHTFKSPEPITYRELGSIEGFITRVELDGYNRPVVWLRQRLDGELVKCVAKGRSLDRIGHYEVAKVLKGMRVQMFGVIHYKDLEKVSWVDVDDVHVFVDDSELPDIYDIVAPNFTNGVEASVYLRRLREDG